MQGYWRDKSQREVDFVIRRAGRRVDAVECKVSPDHAEATSIAAFRARHLEGEDLVVSPGVKQPGRIRRGGRVAQVHAAAGGEAALVERVDDAEARLRSAAAAAQAAGKGCRRRGAARCRRRRCGARFLVRFGPVRR